MIRPSQLAEDLFTADEFYRRVQYGQKADLIDGVIYMAPPDSESANLLNSFLDSLLTMYVAARKSGGRVYVNRFAFQLTEIRAPEPDVAYVRPERLHLIDQRGMRGGPDIAIEIVARESRGRDYGEKRQIYQDAGVSEYWIIDPLQDRAEFLRLQGGRYELVPLERNRIYCSQALPGFWLDVEWLLSHPLPNAYQCLQEILAQPPQI